MDSALKAWAIVVVAIAVLITLLMLGTRKDYAYALVIIWALVGIGVNHRGNDNVVLLTEVAAITVAAVLIAVLAVSLLRRTRAPNVLPTHEPVVPM